MVSVILLEDGSTILLEDGGLLLLESQPDNSTSRIILKLGPRITINGSTSSFTLKTSLGNSRLTIQTQKDYIIKNQNQNSIIVREV